MAHVLCVKVSPGHDSMSTNNDSGKNGYNEYLVDEADNKNTQSVILKCAEIQNAISIFVFQFQNSQF